MSLTINEHLITGAEFHDRDGVFVQWNGANWDTTPDWRADRHSIRLALALQERFGVGLGDVVAIHMQLCLEWPLIERAVWGLGATSVPVRDLSLLENCKPVVAFSDCESSSFSQFKLKVVTLTEGYLELLDEGGVLDTPERATQFRKQARQMAPEVVASIEDGRECSHRYWISVIEQFSSKHKCKPGQTNVLTSREPNMASRVALYAAWGGGIVRTAFSNESTGSYPESFVIL